MAVRVSLKDSKGFTNVVADKVNLEESSDGKEASTTLSVCFDTFPDGAYSKLLKNMCTNLVLITVFSCDTSLLSSDRGRA